MIVRKCKTEINDYILEGLNKSLKMKLRNSAAYPEMYYLISLMPMTQVCVNQLCAFLVTFSRRG